MKKEAIEKLDKKSKWIKFQTSKNYKSSGRSVITFKEMIVESDLHPNKLFLVHENIILERSSIRDSAYEVLSFTQDGDFIENESAQSLGRKFFRTMKVVKQL
jgi:hypothetical protein